MSYSLIEEKPVRNDDLLRSEFGWKDVKKGLGRILFGYLLLIFGSGLCIACTIYSLTMLARHGGMKNQANLGYLWMFYLSTGILGLVTLFAYATILAGKFNCLMSAPEREGARWLMFACITCLLFGPGINAATWVYGIDKPPEFERGADGLQALHFTKLGTFMEIVSMGVGVSNAVFFLMFLRAIGVCFGDRFRQAHVTMYLLLLLGLLVGTMYLMAYQPELFNQREVYLTVGAAWAFALLWYLGLIVSFRTCIEKGLSSLRSPLEADT